MIEDAESYIGAQPDKAGRAEGDQPRRSRHQVPTLGEGEIDAGTKAELQPVVTGKIRREPQRGEGADESGHFDKPAGRRVAASRAGCDRFAHVRPRARKPSGRNASTSRNSAMPTRSR